MIHYVYKVTDIDGRFYIGKRTTSRYEDALEDPYLGSGKWIQTHENKTNLTKEVIEYCGSDEENVVREEFHILNNYQNSLCMNLCLNANPPKYSGKTHPMYDPTIYKWGNADGRVEYATIYDMSKKYNSKTGFSQVKLNIIRSYKNWFIMEENDTITEDYLNYKLRINDHHYKLDKNKYDFISPNGEKMSLTRSEFNKLSGNVASLTNLLNGKEKSYKGWKLASTIDDFDRTKNFNKDVKIYKFFNTKTKETMECTRHEFIKNTNIPVTSVSNLLTNKTKKCRDWILNG